MPQAGWKKVILVFSIVFDTDAKLKADKYVHLGTKFVNERVYDSGLIMYDLYWAAK